jgi:hypothetical protein
MMQVAIAHSLRKAVVLSPHKNHRYVFLSVDLAGKLACTSISSRQTPFCIMMLSRVILVSSWLEVAVSAIPSHNYQLFLYLSKPVL